MGANRANQLHIARRSGVVRFISSRLSGRAACLLRTFVGPPSKAHARDALMDRLLIDVAKNRIDLQVANTMGTSKQVDWTMVGRSDLGGEDRFSVIRGSGDNFVGTGTYIGSPTIITLKNGLLRWLSFNDNGENSDETIYRCQR